MSDKPEYDLEQTLEWCAKNELFFGITKKDGQLAITSYRKNIFACYTIDDPFDAGAVGNAVWAAIYAVRHGTEFHREFGHFPPVRKRDSRDKLAGGPSPDVVSPEAVAPAPDLHTGFVPRRD